MNDRVRSLLHSFGVNRRLRSSQDTSPEVRILGEKRHRSQVGTTDFNEEFAHTLEGYGGQLVLMQYMLEGKDPIGMSYQPFPGCQLYMMGSEISIGWNGVPVGYNGGELARIVLDSDGRELYCDEAMTERWNQNFLAITTWQEITNGQERREKTLDLLKKFEMEPGT